MFFFVPGLSVAAKCTVIGAACVTVAAAEVLHARSLLDSLKTKAGSAFAFRRRAAAKPLEHLSKVPSVPVAAEVDSNDSPDITNPAVSLAEENLSVFAVLETRAPDNDHEIIKASFAMDDVVIYDCDHHACIDVPEDQVKWAAAAKPSEHLSKSHSAPVVAVVDSYDSPDVTNPAVCLAEENLSVFDVLVTRAPDNDNEIIKASFAMDDVVKFDIKMQPLDKLSVEAVVDGGRAAAYDDSVREPVTVVARRSLDASVCGKLPLMPDLEAEAAGVRTKVVCMAAIGDHDLDPIVEKKAEVMTDTVKAQLVSTNNPNGRSWASRGFKGVCDFVTSPIKNIRSGISRVFNHTRDFLRGFIDRIRSWFGKMYGGIYGCVQTVDYADCAQVLDFFTQNLTSLAVFLKDWILDHQVILKKILVVFADDFMETPSFQAHHQSHKRLLMKIYQLLRSECRF